MPSHRIECIGTGFITTPTDDDVSINRLHDIWNVQCQAGPAFDITPSHIDKHLFVHKNDIFASWLRVLRSDIRDMCRLELRYHAH